MSSRPSKASGGVVAALGAGRIEVPLHLGLGDALLRLLWLDDEVRQQGRKNRADLVKERLLLLEALNRIPIDLGFDCDGDGLADTRIEDSDGDGAPDVSIFAASARTSCCRILPPATAPAPVAASTVAAPAKRRSTSRRSTT